MPTFRLGDQHQASDSLSAAEAAIAGPESTTYLVLDERGRVTDELVIRREKTTLHGASMAIHEDDRRTQYVRTDENGDLVLVAVIDHKERALSLFDPPLILAPAKVDPGDVRRTEAAMRVVDRDRPDRQREAGRATREVRYVGDQEVHTARGKLVARRMESQFKADLKLAKASEQATTFIVPDLGIVAEQSAETVRVLGAFGSTDRRTLVRADLVEPDR